MTIPTPVKLRPFDEQHFLTFDKQWIAFSIVKFNIIIIKLFGACLAIQHSQRSTKQLNIGILLTSTANV